jgi:hypothetical protein
MSRLSPDSFLLEPGRRPHDVAAMFDFPPLPESSQSAKSTTEDEEAALAAELPCAIESGGIAADAPDSRADPRVELAWPA